ncbi:MAG: hypothetical protein EVA89_12725 [Sandaracinaceae bacterium]|nr:MAG: hypothetical protein EVA89_12725 [Sandaracinaceae bacterium]
MPAQTPVMFVGGGGGGSVLQGECAEATADCGLTATEFGVVETVLNEARAAQDTCSSYDEARNLDEATRSFESSDAEGHRTTTQSARLRPSLRKRHLSRCAVGPVQHPVLWERRTVAPAVPHYQGPCLRLAAPCAVTTLVPELRFVDGDPGQPRAVGGAVSKSDMQAHRARCIRQVLRDARDEDRSRLRSSNLTASNRPRATETERRLIEQTLPEPPLLATTAAAHATGAAIDPDASDEATATDVEEQAEGCVGAVLEAQQDALEEEVGRQHRDERAETERAMHQSEREARERSAYASDQVALVHREQTLRGASTNAAATVRYRATLRETTATAVRALADHSRASAAIQALPVLRALAMEVAAGKPAQRDESHGVLPDVRTPAPAEPALETVTLLDS